LFFLIPILLRGNPYQTQIKKTDDIKMHIMCFMHDWSNQKKSEVFEPFLEIRLGQQPVKL